MTQRGNVNRGESMIRNNRNRSEFPHEELRKELSRLKSERKRLERKRDALFITVETDEDSGYGLSETIRRLKLIDQRIQQVSNLVYSNR